MIHAGENKLLSLMMIGIPGTSFFLSQSEQKPELLNAPNYREERVKLETAVAECIRWIEQSDTFEAFEQNTVVTYKERYDRVLQNESICNNAIRKYEESMTASNGYFLNDDLGDSDNTQLFNVDPPRFTGEESTDFLDFLETYLTDQFESWEMDRSPDVIVLYGDLIPDKTILRRLLTVCEKTGAVLLADFKKFHSLNAMLSHAKKSQFTDPSAAAGHGIFSSSWIKGRGAHTELGEKEDLVYPSAPLIAGVMNRLGPAKLPAGYKNGVLKGAKEVLFSANRRVTAILHQLGMFGLEKVKGEVRVFGGQTLNSSNDPEFKFLNTVRTRNALTKTLMQFATEISYTDMGSEEEQELREAITTFLNSCKSAKLIRDFQEPEIDRDRLHPEIVYIKANISYRDPAIFYLIDLKRDDTGADPAEN